MGTTEEAPQASLTTEQQAKERRARRKQILAAKRARKRHAASLGRATAALSKSATTTSKGVPTKPLELSGKKPAKNKPSDPVNPALFVYNEPFIEVQDDPPVVLVAEPTWQRYSSARPKQQLPPRQSDLSREPLSKIQLKQVDDAFEKLFGYAYGTKFDLAERDKSSVFSRMPPSLQRTLCRALGTTATARILQNKVTTTQISTPKREIPLMTRIPKRPRTIKSSMPFWSAQAPTTTTTLAQPTSTRAHLSAESNQLLAPRAQKVTRSKKTAGVDDLLQKMNDTGKVSTIAKTAVDWESFKAGTGLAASLEEHTESKGAFLKRQDFLERVDHRKFAHERQERERERAKRK